VTERRRTVAPQHGPAPAVSGNVQDPSIQVELARIAKVTGLAPDVVRETWSERAGIREYLGGMSRNVAESRALADTSSILGLQPRRSG